MKRFERLVYILCLIAGGADPTTAAVISGLAK